MLIWKGRQSLLNWDADESEEKSKKIFTIATQPGIVNDDADWVSNWEADENADDDY